MSDIETRISDALPPRLQPLAAPAAGLLRDRLEKRAEEALARLKEAAMAGDNVFAVLMDAARVCSLQQVTEAFFEVGGQYRRNV